MYHIGRSQVRQPATSTAYANHHVLAFTQPFLSGMPRTAASNSALMKPAASMSVTAFVAVIQTTGVISNEVATHHASLSENWARIIENQAAMKSAPPNAEAQ